MPQLKAQVHTLTEIQNLQQEWAQKGQEAAAMLVWTTLKVHIEQVLKSITAVSFQSLYYFVDKLLDVHNQQLSTHVSKMLDQHGEAILNRIHAHQPDIVGKWSVDVSGKILVEEGCQFTKNLQLGENQTMSELLVMFLLKSEQIAPTLCQLLHVITTKQQPKAARESAKGS